MRRHLCLFPLLFTLTSVAGGAGAQTPSPETSQSLPSEAVTIDNYRRNYEGQASASERAYDDRVRTSRINQSGALEGGWILLDADEKPLVALQLRGGGNRPIEGAWRSLALETGLNPTGLIIFAEHTEPALRIDYQNRKTTAVYRLDLQRLSETRFSGTLTGPEGKVTPVSLTAQ